MTQKVLTYLLVTMIAMQSFVAMADVHQPHQSGGQHLEFEHAHDDSEMQLSLLSELDGVKREKKIRTIGNKWSTFQTHTFNNNSQPYYVMLSPKGQLLGNPIGYTPDINEYKDYLDCGLEAFKSVK
ncbi:MAG: hypothetical protein KUG73_03965 [Pseudomonadales bacterium]|nr:hypothetical protein [Pseudomonadales bacterium]